MQLHEMSGSRGRSLTGHACRRTALGVILAVACAFAMAPKPAWAHAELIASHPAANSAVKGPAIAITLRYNSRVDPTRSTVTLLTPNGKIRKIAIKDKSAPNVLSAAVAGLVLKGAYVLRWQALAGDGHITRGEVPFRVQ